MMYSIGDWILTHYFMWNKFDARSDLKITHKVVNGNDDRAIFFFPYWTGDSSAYVSLSNQFPDSTHVFFDYPNQVMSANVKVSLNYIDEIIYEALVIIRELRKKNIKEIILVGSSFGSNIALKLSTLVRVEKVVLNMIDKNYARCIFESPALSILKKKLHKRGFTLVKAKKLYRFISTDYLVPKIKNKKNIHFLIFASDNDIFCPFSEFKSELRVFDKHKIDYILKRNRFFGHIGGIYKNLVFSNRIRDFIED